MGEHDFVKDLDGRAGLVLQDQELANLMDELKARYMPTVEKAMEGTESSASAEGMDTSE